MNGYAELEKWVQKINEGMLATIEEDGPFASLVAFLYEPAKEHPFGSFYFLLSDLARHTKNVKKNASTSLLMAEASVSKNIYEKERLTVLGKLCPVTLKSAIDSLKERYLNTFPNAALFVDLPDFHFYQLLPHELYWVGGFGKIQSLKLTWG